MDSAEGNEKQGAEPEHVRKCKELIRICLWMIGRGRGADRWHYQCRKCGGKQAALKFPSKWRCGTVVTNTMTYKHED